MKVSSPNLNFNGLILIGSVPQNKKESFDKLVENQKFARIVSNQLEQKSEDTFIVNNSIRDARGITTDRVNTYILTGRDARLVNKFNEIKSQLTTMFIKDFQSDAFISSLNHKIDAISKEQMNTAQFIAENKLGKAKEWSTY